MEKIKDKIQEKLKNIVLMVLGLVFLVPTYAFAAPNYGQNFGNYTLTQLFWVAVVFIAVALVGSLVKRNVVGIVVTIIVGAVVVGFIKDPTGFQSMGSALWSVIKG